jgi:hypothetical protein
MTFFRFLMLLSLVVWVGGIIFFSFVVAPTVFTVLPTRHLAGAVVTRSLSALHWMAIVAGVVFLALSFIVARRGIAGREVTLRHIFVVVMLALTLTSEFGVSPRMTALRTGMGEIDSVAQSDPRRVEFNRLHRWSTWLESGVLLLGLATIFIVSRE